VENYGGDMKSKSGTCRN